MRRVLGDPAGQGEFESQGYVTVPVLSPTELNDLLNAVQNLHPEGDVRSGDGSSVVFSPADPSTARRRQMQQLLQPLFEPHIRRLLPDFRFFSGIYLIKPPGSTGFGWHTDWQLTADWSDVSVRIWLPLTDPGSQTLRVVDGSHRFAREMGAPVPVGFFAPFTDELDRRSRGLAINPGEAVLFDSGLVHRSVANQSSRAMVAVQVTAIPADATPVFCLRAGDARYELIDASGEFWIDNNFLGPDAERQPHWRGLGFVEDPDQHSWEREFRLLFDVEERTGRGRTRWRSLRRHPSTTG